MRFAARQILGAREDQEDFAGVLDARVPADGAHEHTVLLLADGLGGREGGELASRMVVEAAAEAYAAATGRVAERQKRALQAANTAIAEAVAGDGRLEGIGSTLVVATVTDQGLEWISVGDSPLWLLRGGTLQRLNADHSMLPVFMVMVEEGSMRLTDALTDPKRHALRSVLKGEAIKLVDQSPAPLPVVPEDRVLLASDGLLALQPERIVAVLQGCSADELDGAADTLLAAVHAAGAPNQDNTTVLLYAPGAR